MNNLSILAVTLVSALAAAGGAAESKSESILFLEPGKGVRTAPFHVAEHEGDMLGVWLKADQKFLDAAATADFLMDEKTLKVTIDCPVPDGLEIDINGQAAWAGDSTEFHVSPDGRGDVVHQYILNAAGKFEYYRYVNGGQSRPPTAAIGRAERTANGFRTCFTIPREEVFPSPPEEGGEFTLNFVRVGKTCSGISSWSDIGRSPLTPSKFGRAVIGSPKAYFVRRLGDFERLVAGWTDPASRAAAEKAIAPVRAAVAEQAGDPGAYGRLSAMFDGLRQALVSARLRGEKLIAFAPRSFWGDQIEPTETTEPLERIAITMARNSRAVYGFSLANLSDVDWSGQIKAFNGDYGVKFNEEYPGGVPARAISVREVMPIEMNSGAIGYDPLLPLPLGTVLRIPARHTALVWLDVDSSKLPAGRHECFLCVKRARSAFRTFRIPVRIDVLDIDLGAVEVQKAGYDWSGAQGHPKPEIIRNLASLEGNVLFVGNGPPGPGSMAQMQEDGSWKGPLAFDRVDKAVEYRLKATGIDAKKLIVWLQFAPQDNYMPPRRADGKGYGYGDPLYYEGCAVTMKRAVDHVVEKYGIPKGNVIVYTWDEPDASCESVDVDPTTPNASIAIAYRIARKIKEIDPEIVTFTNPHATGSYAVGPFCRTLERLRECYDIIEFYRPNLSPAVVKKAQELKFRQIWTYSIYDKRVPPARYALDVWENIRDGFDTSAYWQIEDHAGGDGFDSYDTFRNRNAFTDYGTCYTDRDLDTFVYSRRALAHDLAYEDAKLVKWLRERHRNDGEKLAAIDAIVRKTTEEGSMEAMDRARQALFGLR